MAPNQFDGPTNVLDELDDSVQTEVTSKETEKVSPREYKLKWGNIFMHTFLHVSAVVGLYYALTTASWSTLLFNFFSGYGSLLGITAGVHRLWSHRSYKARFPLRAFLVFLNTLAFQTSIIKWASEHRIHHKYSETDADPYNSKRGFFYSHIGWLLSRQHEDVKAKAKGLDISDLYADPLLKYQHKYYPIFMPLICFVLPTVVPMYLFDEGFKAACFVNILRWCVCLNIISLVNSAAHLYGYKPYDRFINPGENRHISIMALGEGWHNYHHTFPWDFKASELFGFKINPSAMFIMFMAKIGQAYDLKSVAPEVIRKRVERTGDGSHELWGYGDKDLNESEVTTTYKKTR